MATPLTPTDIGGVLQKAYADDPQANALFDDFPLWKLLDHVGKTGGSDYNISVIYQAATRVGSTPASVYGQVQLAPAAQFSFTPKRQYGFSSIDGLAWAQSGVGMEKKQIASFINAVHEQNMAVVKTMAKNHALYLSRGGTGTLGIIDTTTVVGSAVLVLTKASDQYNFEEGQVLQVSATDGGAARAGSLTILTVPGNGTLVMTGVLTAGVAAVAVGDFVFLNGDGQTQTFPGLKSWCPFNATKGTFGGVNRDLSPRRLAGFFLDASLESLTIDAAISALLSRFKANKGKGTHGFLNPMDWEALSQTGSTNVVVEQGGERIFGFKTLTFTFDGSKIRFVEDSTIPQGEAWVLDASKWEVRFVDKDDIAIDDRDGLTIRKAFGTTGADTWEMTFYSYPYGLMLKKGGVPGQCLAGCKLY